MSDIKERFVKRCLHDRDGTPPRLLHRRSQAAAAAAAAAAATIQCMIIRDHSLRIASSNHYQNVVTTYFQLH
jgi:hypothetical protein